MTFLSYPGLRHRRGAGLSRMILLSLGVHLLLLTAAIFLPLHPSAARFTLGPVYSVNLVSVSSSILRQQATRDPLQDLAAAALPDGTRTMKKAVKMTAPPIKRLETKKTLTNPAVEELKKKLGERKATDSTTAASSAAGGEVNDRLADYYTVIWSRIKSQWTLPGGISPRDNIEAVVNIRILRNGAIVSTNFEKRSGLAYFDNSVIKALKKAHPLPPLPEWYRENGLDIGIRFLSADLR